MKYLLVLVAVLGGLHVYSIHHANPREIVNPVYLESRVAMKVPQLGRKVEYVLVGEMASHDDCHTRSQEYLAALFAECDDFQLVQHRCRDEIDHRYRRLFEGQSAHTTYLSLNKGSRFERNGRMVIWGLKEHEAAAACEHVKQDLQKTYRGAVDCVKSSLS